MYVDDCTFGTRRMMKSDVIEPLNIGSDEGVSINQLVDIIEDIAGVKLTAITSSMHRRASMAAIATTPRLSTLQFALSPLA